MCFGACVVGSGVGNPWGWGECARLPVCRNWFCKGREEGCVCVLSLKMLNDNGKEQVSLVSLRA